MQRYRSVTTFRPRSCAAWRGWRAMAGWPAGCSALANALDGMSRERAAGQAGMDRQTLRDWVIRFNAEGVEGLRDRPRSGRPPWLDEGQLAAFKALVLRGPDPERDGVSSWRAKDLCRIVEDRFGVSYSENGMLDCCTSSTCPGRRPGRCIRRPIPRRRRASKKIPGADRRDRPRPSRGRAARGLVPGRGPGRPDRPHLPPLVREGHPPARPARPAPRGGLSVRRRLPGARRRRRPGAARGERRRHAGDARRAQRSRHARRPCRRHHGPRRLAHRQGARRARPTSPRSSCRPTRPS